MTDEHRRVVVDLGVWDVRLEGIGMVVPDERLCGARIGRRDTHVGQVDRVCNLQRDHRGPHTDYQKGI